MNWNDLAKRISEMPADKRKDPVVFLEPYDCPSAYSEMELIQAQEDILVEADGINSYRVMAVFMSDKDAYGTGFYWVEATSEKEAEEKAHKMAEKSHYNDHRIPDLTIKTSVMEVKEGYGIPVRKGEYMLR